jgi:hypothetical protein
MWLPFDEKVLQLLDEGIDVNAIGRGGFGKGQGARDLMGRPERLQTCLDKQSFRFWKAHECDANYGLLRGRTDFLQPI